jgi:DNA adenine methylase
MSANRQHDLFEEFELSPVRVPPARQLLKWIGNKQRSAGAIAALLPSTYERYLEPFVGGGAVLAAMAPSKGLAGDLLKPLIEIWWAVQRDPAALAGHYQLLWERYVSDRQQTYDATLARYNLQPNGYDLFFLCRTCYGGVVRFTKSGTMSTPLGPHLAVPPARVEQRLREWGERIKDTEFKHAAFEETMDQAGRNDVIYCDPPYVYSQAILYGAQDFGLKRLWQAIDGAVSRGAKVALSIDGSKKSGRSKLQLHVPDGLFRRDLLVPKGGSMLKRFQRRDGNVDDEQVVDRLLLTW